MFIVNLFLPGLNGVLDVLGVDVALYNVGLLILY